MGNILDKINSPADVKNLQENQLELLCGEIRETILETVSKNGGHLASNLGVVELTVAMCRVMSPPKDSIVWDVGHQSYPYKLLTGRRDQFSTIRLKDGLSGFPCRKESEFDLFSTGHSSTSISSALGISEANYINGDKDSYVVAVIGDGALTGGMAYEAMNNAGRLHRNFIVILNDNNMSISKNVGAVAKNLTYLRSRPGYIRGKNRVENRLRKMYKLGRVMATGLKKVKRGIKRLFYYSNIFEDMGFSYYGPMDGHNLKDLTDMLESAKLINKPVLLHVCTNKGQGYSYAEESPSVYHGLSSFDRNKGIEPQNKKGFSDVFGDSLCRLAGDDEKICAITAAMDGGTGLLNFRSKFRQRFFDVGIAEGHATAFAGGLAAKGMLPVFAVYSTFLQRAYDQLIHDIALQQFKVILAIDRAGVVGEDGKTHQGVFDTAYLQTIPNITVYSPSFFNELEDQLSLLVKQGEGMCAIRYPRGKELYRPAWHRSTNRPFDVYGDEDADMALITYGRLFSFAAQAMEALKAQGINMKIIKLNCIIPIDMKVLGCVKNSSSIFFYEEAVKRGGVGEHFAALLTENGYKGQFIHVAIDNPFIEHAHMFDVLEELGLDAKGMEMNVLKHEGAKTEVRKQTISVNFT